MKNETILHKRYDASLFKDRLVKLMEEKGMVDDKGNPDHGQLYMAMYPGGKSGDEDMLDIIRPNTTKTRRNTIARTQYNWIHGESFPKMDDLLLLCNTLDCDINYLLGLDAEYINRDEKYVCEYLGLSRNVISKLHQMSLFSKWNINDIKHVPTGPAFKNHIDDWADGMRFKFLSEEILHGIEVLFTERKEQKLEEDEHIVNTTDFSILLSLIHELCSCAPDNLCIDRHTEEEYLELYRDSFEGIAPNPPMTSFKKDGISILTSDETNLIEEICVDVSEYHRFSIEGKYDYFIDFNLEDIINQITRNAIDDLLKEMSNQFEKGDDKMMLLRER